MNECEHGEIRESFDGCVAICTYCGTITHALNEAGSRELDRLKQRSVEIGRKAIRKALKEAGLSPSDNGIS